jgi:hypothetical protein
MYRTRVFRFFITSSTKPCLNIKLQKKNTSATCIAWSRSKQGILETAWELIVWLLRRFFLNEERNVKAVLFTKKPEIPTLWKQVSLHDSSCSAFLVELSCMYVCMCICMYSCMYVHIYIHTYIHTYIYTHTTNIDKYVWRAAEPITARLTCHLCV